MPEHEMLRFMVERMVREGRSEQAITRAVRQAEKARDRQRTTRRSRFRAFRPATA
jgi:hypothetical protein